MGLWKGNYYLEIGLWRVQTPQAFKYDLLKEAFQKAQRDSYYGTDEGSLDRILR